MSGLEIAGLVLGVLPLIIKAFDGYQEVAERLRIWKELRSRVADIMGDLENGRLDFRMNLENLLRPIATDKAHLDALMNDPGGTEWSDRDEAALKKRLGESYDRYIKSMKSLRQAMISLKCEMDPLLPTDEEAAADEKTIKERAKNLLVIVNVLGGEFKSEGIRDSLKRKKSRVIFSAERGSKAARLLEALQQGNRDLEDLLRRVDNNAKVRQQYPLSGDPSAGGPAGSTTLDKAICSFWRSAGALYTALQAAWGRCSCSKQHASHMLLQHPTAPVKRERFELLLTTEDPKSAWELRRAFVTVGRDEGRRAATATAPASCPTTPSPAIARQPAHRQSSALSLKSSLRKTTGSILPGGDVSLQAGTAPTATLQILAAATINMKALPTSRKATFETSTVELPSTVGDVEVITSLCKSLECTTTRKTDDGCAGFLLHDNEMGLLLDSCDTGSAGDCSRYYVYPQPRLRAPQGLKSISLERLIRADKLVPLSWRRRVFLSMTLASSFLQLLDSPWISHLWTEADIVFFFLNPDDPDDYYPDRPHVQSGDTVMAGVKSRAAPACLGASTPPASPGGADANAPPSPPPSPSPAPTRIPSGGGAAGLTADAKRHDALSRLGIVLLELFGREHIARWRERLEYPEPTGPRDRLALDCAAANWWRSTIAEGEEPSWDDVFKGAIEWCMSTSRDSAATRTRQQSWREEMLSHVVGPLERTYRQIGSR